MLSNIFCPPPFSFKDRHCIFYAIFLLTPPFTASRLTLKKRLFSVFRHWFIYLFIYLFYSYKAIFCIFDFFSRATVPRALITWSRRKKKNKVFANCCQNEILSRAVFLLIPFYLFTHFIYIYIFSFSSTRSEFLIIPAYILTGSSLYKSVFLSRDC